MTTLAYRQTTRGDFIILNSNNHPIGARTDDESLAKEFIDKYQGRLLSESEAIQLMRAFAGLSDYESQRRAAYAAEQEQFAIQLAQTIDELNDLRTGYTVAADGNNLTIRGDWNDRLHAEFKKRGIRWHGRGYYTHTPHTSRQFEYHTNDTPLKCWVANCSQSNKIKLAFKAAGLLEVK